MIGSTASPPTTNRAALRQSRSDANEDRGRRREDDVRRPHRGGVAEDDPGGDDCPRWAASDERQRDPGCDTRGRHRLGVELEPGLDLPGAVRPRSLAEQQPGQERPEREQRRRRDPDPPAAGHALSDERRREDRDGVRHDRDRDADADGDLVVDPADDAEGHEREAEEERPAHRSRRRLPFDVSGSLPPADRRRARRTPRSPSGGCSDSGATPIARRGLPRPRLRREPAAGDRRPAPAEMIARAVSM